MILFKTHTREISSNCINYYLRYLDNTSRVVRVDRDAPINNISILIDNNDEKCQISFSQGNETIHIDKVKATYYRRGGLSMDGRLYRPRVNNSELTEYLEKELNIVTDYIHSKTKNGQITFGNHFEDELDNKLVQLETAKEVGLSIPKTLVCTSKKELITFLKVNDKVIFKPLHSHFSCNDENRVLESSGTRFITHDDIKQLKDQFFPTQFQIYTEKKYEIRVFVWLNQIYAMAIFSQNNEQTKVDFRNYDMDKPNRCIPYLLSNDVVKKIKSFMKKLNLTTGSIDLIRDVDDQYVFLEVNTTGQFGMVSQPCNYYIEKKIAQKLV